MSDSPQVTPDPERSGTIRNTPDGCGCAARQAALNEIRPGLGDWVKRIADPVARWLGWR